VHDLIMTLLIVCIFAVALSFTAGAYFVTRD
jgi:hypothetical protein